MIKSDSVLLYDGNTVVEESLLKAVLLFNEAKKDSSRTDMLQKALLALIIEGDNQMTKEDIRKTINQRFGLMWSEADTNTHLKKLVDLDLVIISETGKIQVREMRKNGRSFTRDILEETNLLITRIEKKLELAYKSSIPRDINIRLVIKKALSVYFRHSGLEFVGLKKSATEKETLNAVDSVKIFVPNNKRLCELLIRVLAETLHEPVEEDRVVLEKWARAYIAMQVIGFDPVLANFKENKLRGKSFVIDTDVILNCITKNACNSGTYRVMIEKLKTLGCKLYVPSDVIAEVDNNIKSARGCYSRFDRTQILNFSDEILQYRVGNIIVEDYVRMLRKNPDMSDMPFDIHLENFVDKDNPTLLMNNLTDVFGKKNMDNKLPDLIDEDKKVDELRTRILQHTEQSINGERRTTAVNKELSNSDAVLYLTICEMNDKCDDGDFFANKVYLLTSMKKGIRSAKEMGEYKENIICSPTALLSILMENGQIHSDDVNLINLLDNPFLVYTANQIWDKVEPLLKAGANLKYKELQRLRLDVDTDIDKILTLENRDDRYKESKRLQDHGYFFGQDIVEATELAEGYKKTIELQESDIVTKDKTIAAQKGVIEAQTEENRRLKEDLKKERSKNAYLVRIGKLPPDKGKRALFRRK